MTLCCGLNGADKAYIGQNPQLFKMATSVKMLLALSILLALGAVLATVLIKHLPSLHHLSYNLFALGGISFSFAIGCITMLGTLSFQRGKVRGILTHHSHTDLQEPR